MTDDGTYGSPPRRSSTDRHSDFHTNGASYERPHIPQQFDSADSSSLPRTTSLSPRRSIDGSITSDPSHWPDALSTAEEPDPRETSFNGAETATLVDQNFDENVLRAICEMNVRAQLDVRVQRSNHAAVWNTIASGSNKTGNGILSGACSADAAFQILSATSGGCSIPEETRFDRGGIWQGHAEVGARNIRLLRHQRRQGGVMLVLYYHIPLLSQSSAHSSTHGRRRSGCTNSWRRIGSALRSACTRRARTC